MNVIAKLERIATRIAGGNRYYLVLHPFKVWVKTDAVPSNTYYGAARLLEPIYEEVTAKPMDELHLLVGGNFLVSGKKVYRVRFSKPEAFSPGLKNHSGIREPIKLPMDKLEPVSPEDVSSPAYNTAP